MGALGIFTTMDSLSFKGLTADNGGSWLKKNAEKSPISEPHSLPTIPKDLGFRWKKAKLTNFFGEQAMLPRIWTFSHGVAGD